MIIYVCAPYSGDIINNTKQAMRYARKISKEGNTPIVPHLNFMFLDDATQREEAMRGCLELVEMCDYLYVFGEPTEGMKREIKRARETGVTVIENPSRYDILHNQTSAEDL